MMYSINPQEEQDSLTAHLRATYPNVRIFTGGVPDEDFIDPKVPGSGVQVVDGQIREFMILWYSNAKKGRKQGFGGKKLDSYYATVDIAVIGPTDDRARRLMNIVSDELVDFKVAGGGRVDTGTPLYADGRQVKQESTKPARWMRTNRFNFGIASKHTP